jgi:hypothetical protein
LYDQGVNVRLIRDTLSKNFTAAARAGNGGSGGKVGSGGKSGGAAGGGIDVASGNKVLLHTTLIAANKAGGNSSDISGSLNSASDYNFVGDGSGGLSTIKRNVLGSSTHRLDPLLAPLGNYGGPTQTMALLPGSPALNRGSSAYGGSSASHAFSGVE